MKNLQYFKDQIAKKHGFEDYEAMKFGHYFHKKFTSEDAMREAVENYIDYRISQMDSYQFGQGYDKGFDEGYQQGLKDK